MKRSMKRGLPVAVLLVVLLLLLSACFGPWLEASLPVEETPDAEPYSNPDWLFHRVPSVDVNSLFPSIAVGPTGEVHICYRVDESMLWHAVLDDSGEWATTEVAAAPQSSPSQIAIGVEGDAHLSYATEENELGYARVVGGEVVVEVFPELVHVSASIALDAEGQAHFAFYPKDGEWPPVVGYIRAEDDAWVTEWIPRDRSGDFRPSLAISGEGTVYVVFPDSSSSVLLRSPGETEWTRLEIVLGESPIALDSDGVLHVLENAHYSSLVHRWLEEGEWQEEAAVVLDEYEFSSEWDMALDGAGFVHVVFHVWHQGIYYATNAGGEWATTWINAEGDGAVSIAVDPDSVPHIVYHAWGSGGGVRYARPSRTRGFCPE